MREKEAGDFVDGFVSKGGVEQPNFVVLEILPEEMSEFTGGAGIVRAIEVHVGAGLQFFEAAWPDGVSNTPGDGAIGDSKAAVLKIPRVMAPSGIRKPRF